MTLLYTYASFAARIIVTGFILSNSAAASDVDELKKLLNEFLVGVDSAEVHEEFWAEDLVYTSSSGTRTNKTEIMAGFADSVDTAGEESATEYGAEDVDVRLYGTTAIVAFRLVARTRASEPEHYLNTGTFLKRNDKWQVVAWQATRVAAK